MNNYNFLSSRKTSKLSSQEPEVVGNAPNSEGKMRTSWLMSLMMIVAFFIAGNNVFAQTTIINPATSGVGTFQVIVLL